MTYIESLATLADQATKVVLPKIEPVLHGEEQDAVFAIINETFELAENGGFFDRKDE